MNILFYLDLTIPGAADWAGLASLRGSTTFGGSLLLGIIGGHNFWTLRLGVATFRGSLLLEIYGKIARHD